MKSRNPLSPFNKAGFNTLEALAGAIEKHKIVALSSGAFMFGPGGPSVRGAGVQRWSCALIALEKHGFDWRAHVVPPPPLIEWTDALFGIPDQAEAIHLNGTLGKLNKTLLQLTKVINGLRSDITGLRAELKSKKFK